MLSRSRGPVSGEEAFSWPDDGAVRAAEEGDNSPQCLERSACTDTRRDPLSSAQPPEPITALEHNHVG